MRLEWIRPPRHDPSAPNYTAPSHHCHRTGPWDLETEISVLNHVVAIGTRYLGHVTGYQPIRDQYFLILQLLTGTDTSKQPIRTRQLDHVNGNQPIRDQYFLIR
eukprot:sb/3478084/